MFSIDRICAVRQRTSCLRLREMPCRTLLARADVALGQQSKAQELRKIEGIGSRRWYTNLSSSSLITTTLLFLVQINSAKLHHGLVPTLTLTPPLPNGEATYSSR